MDEQECEQRILEARMDERDKQVDVRIQELKQLHLATFDMANHLIDLLQAGKVVDAISYLINMREFSRPYIPRHIKEQADDKEA